MKFHLPVEKKVILNLRSRPDRLDLATRELLASGITGAIERFDAIKIDGHKGGAIGNALSFRQIVQDAVDSKLSRIVIFEDDLLFCKRDIVQQDLDDCVAEIDSVKCDAYYLGVNFGTLKSFITVNGNSWSATHFSGTHAIVLNKSGMMKMLEKLPSNEQDARQFITNYKFLDLWVSNMLKCMGFVKLIYSQRDGLSDISGKMQMHDYQIRTNFQIAMRGALYAT